MMRVSADLGHNHYLPGQNFRFVKKSYTSLVAGVVPCVFAIAVVSLLAGLSPRARRHASKL